MSILAIALASCHSQGLKLAKGRLTAARVLGRISDTLDKEGGPRGGGGEDPGIGKALKPAETPWPAAIFARAAFRADKKMPGRTPACAGPGWIHSAIQSGPKMGALVVDPRRERVRVGIAASQQGFEVTFPEPSTPARATTATHRRADRRTLTRA